MIDISKLMLSDDELQLVNNAEWILTKRKIMNTVDQLLGYVCESQKGVIEKEKEWLPQEAFRFGAKIARGENYLQLPYLMLDYPRCFADTDILLFELCSGGGIFLA